MNKKTYKVVVYLMATPIAGIFYKITKKYFKNRRKTKVENAWWYGYLLWYAKHYNLEKIKKEKREKVVVHKLMSNYDFFLFYNTVFHQDCISHIIYELSQGNIPIIDDTWHVWNQFFEQPICPISESEKIEDLKVSDEDSTLFTPSYISESKTIRRIWSKCIKDFCRLNQNEQAYIDDEIHTVLSQGKRVMAIVYRGTDYKAAKFYQPDIDDVIKDAQKWMIKYNYDKYILRQKMSVFLTGSQ